ncbi:choline transporter-like protein 4 [Clupea harengus]|uniref:Choline transporter-like protein n=1 Tax=Clupea harengus TaxID=7950 RepID=A0A6P8GT82_CLUHA|nr:choline transporter-like protein 4 [Clupea harengus]XP_031441823.1 choline transporter-like protein 4 [Clupea harengus]
MLLRMTDTKMEEGHVAPYDPDFDGPVRKRNCTDPICFLLFLAALACYIALGVTAWLLGDPQSILHARNSTGMYCGAGDNRLKPSVFYVDLLKCDKSTNALAAALGGVQCPTTQVCVEKCPSQYWMLPAAAYAPAAQPKDHFQQEYCDPRLDLETTNLTVQKILDGDLCPSFYTPTKAVSGRCFTNSVLLDKTPNFTVTNQQSFNETALGIMNATSDIMTVINNRGVWVRIYEDFAMSLHWILLCLAVAMVVSAVFLLLLRYLASVLIFTVILGVMGVGAYGIYQCHSVYKQYLTSETSLGNLNFNSSFGVYLQLKETWLALMIILIVMEVIIILVLISLGKSIYFAVDLLEESNKVVSYVTSTAFYPLITFMLLLVCLSYWGMTSLFLATSGVPLYRVVALNTAGNCSSITGLQSCSPNTFDSSKFCSMANCMFYKYDGLFKTTMVYLQLINLLLFLWTVNFFLTLGQCTLAGTFSSYYWAFNKPADIPPSPLSQAFIRNLQFHVGTLAFAAGILPLFQPPRIFLEFLFRKSIGSSNPISKCIKNCTYCFLNSFLQIMSSNANVMVSVYGYSFWVSARQAHRLVKRNILRVEALDSVADVLLFFGKLLVVGTVGVLAFLVTFGIIAIPGDTIFQASKLNYACVPIIVVFVGAYLIAQAFFSVYTTSVDTLFICYMDDLERNDGTVLRPYYTTRNLMRVLHKTDSITF